MKFMLIMNSPRDGYEQYVRWPKDVLQANIAFMRQFGRKLREAGELAGGEGLAAPTRAKLVRAGKDGRPVTDGVFPEAKEYLAGFWIIEVASAARACEIAADLSTAPGVGSKPFQIEVREMIRLPSADRG
jgi:hypothetical protein